MPSFQREHPLTAPPSQGDECLAFLFRARALLVASGTLPRPVRLPFSRIETDPRIAGLRRFGSLDGVPCYAGRWNDAETPNGTDARDLLGLRGRLDETSMQIAGLAIHLIHWERTHTFCGACGARTVLVEAEDARRCSACDHLAYPRISPSVIVAVTKGDCLLLARGTRFALPMFSVLAGFVEPGETLEECVQREVREEVGIEVKDLRYFGSQPWPFPDSLMIGFTAAYASGELRPDPREIGEAGWFRHDAMPRIPEHDSISRRLIDWFINSAHATG